MNVSFLLRFPTRNYIYYLTFYDSLPFNDVEHFRSSKITKKSGECHFFVLRMSISRVCDLQKYFGLLALLVRHNYLYCTLTVCVYCLISRPCTLELTLTHTHKNTLIIFGMVIILMLAK